MTGRSAYYKIYWIIALVFNIVFVHLHHDKSKHPMRLDFFINKQIDIISKYTNKEFMINMSLTLFCSILGIEIIKLYNLCKEVVRLGVDVYIERLIPSVFDLAIVFINIGFMLASSVRNYIEITGTDMGIDMGVFFILFELAITTTNTIVLFALRHYTHDQMYLTSPPSVSEHLIWTITKPDVIFNNDIDDPVECSICLVNKKNVVYACGHYML